MKKLIAVLIALAMVLSMSVMAFAEYAGRLKPSEICTTEEEWNKAISLEEWELSDYANFWMYIDVKNKIDEQGLYTDEDGNYMSYADAQTAYALFVVGNIAESPSDAAKELMEIVSSGDVAVGDLIKAIGDSAMGGIGGDGESGDLSETISGIIDQITGGDKEPEVSADVYADELADLINSGATFEEVTQKISDDLANGKIVVNQLPDIAKEISARVEAGEIENNETVQQILDFIDGLGGGEGGEGGFEFPSFGEITLPWDNGNSESGSFLDTILGIIGSIGDLFNPSEPDEPTPTPTPGTDDDNGEIPNTGDVSFVAVAAVAAVAGAAFVLTRKKSDAE